MALRGIDPVSVTKRLKAMVYGAAGSGKTTFCISFPKTYLIDTERGAENSQYTELLAKGGGVIFQTSDFDELMTEIMSLMTEKHEYKTLVIDPLTTVYNDLLDKVALKVGTEFGKHYSEANKKMKHLCSLLLRLDMNVIITSHAKTEYGSNMTVIGNTFDCFKKLDYLFDLVFEVQKRGEDHIAIPKKSRVESIKTNESFTFSYDEIANRYGREALERDATPIEFATSEQIDQLFDLIQKHKIPSDTCEKWLEKANAQNFKEMPKASIQKCIDYLMSK